MLMAPLSIEFTAVAPITRLSLAPYQPVSISSAAPNLKLYHSKKDNAMNVVNTLKKAGISYYAVKVVNANGSSFYRVYGGRSNNKAELSSLSARIDKLCGTKSKVVPL